MKTKTQHPRTGSAAPTTPQMILPNTLGIDVSKTKLDCALQRAIAPGKRLDKSVANTAAGIRALLVWLDSKGCGVASTRVVLEPTGVYHETATWLLHDAGYTVALVNPARLRSYAGAIGVGSKNDQIDAALLARYGATEPLEPWQPPSVCAAP